MWIESVLGHSFLACNLLWPCSLIETSDTELSVIHWLRKVSYLKSPVSTRRGARVRAIVLLVWSSLIESEARSADSPAPMSRRRRVRIAPLDQLTGPCSRWIIVKRFFRHQSLTTIISVKGLDGENQLSDVSSNFGYLSVISENFSLSVSFVNFYFPLVKVIFTV